MYKNKRFLLSLAWLLSVHAASLLVLTVFRIIEFTCLHGMITDNAASTLTAFVKGIWFDNVTACYVMVVPLALTLIAATLGFTPRKLRKAAMWWFAALYAIVFMASAANTPYFEYFFKNINSSIFEWFGYAATTAGMVFQEKSYILHIALYFIITAGYIIRMIFMRRYFDRLIEACPADGKRPLPVALRSVATVAMVLLCLFGIRGRTGYNPIKISQAYYCDDPFLNQLGINPAFNLLTSALDDMRKENSELHLMPEAEAVAAARASLGITGSVDSMHVMRRNISMEAGKGKPNVVVILMESMSANLLSTFGQEKHLTPTLDSLYNHSLAFTRCYSAGIHTNHGMTAALYSFPALMFRNLMKGTVTPHRTGLPTVLKQYGYHNMFFMTHEAQYDNMKAFFTTNGYDEIFSQEDYPKSEVVNSFGVSDHFLFGYALDKINRQAATRKPFLATLLTISNHPPYVIPSFFKPKTKEPETQIVEYADWAIGDFLKKASREAWYRNTVFVIMADHGKLVGKAQTEAPESYNHIPLIIFGPGVPTMRYDGLANQIDVMPTLLSILKLGGYVYDGFGQNLTSSRRPMVFYSADNQLIARDDRRVYVYNHKMQKSFCYNIQSDGSLKETPMCAAFKPLQHYVFSMIQTAQFALKRQK